MFQTCSPFSISNGTYKPKALWADDRQHIGELLCPEKRVLTDLCILRREERLVDV